MISNYDGVGNIGLITDNIFTASRTFAYDALNRLTAASGDFGANQSFQNCAYVYSPIGNIDNKCGVVFTYGDVMHPSAVTSISSGKSYSYDANGNMLTGGGRTFTWDIDNRVTSVTLGGSTTTMEYDYTGMRVKKDGSGGLTLYPFQGYEIDPGGTITKFIRIGVENFASKKGTAKYFYHNDHLGSVNVITDFNGSRVQLNEYDPWGGVSRTEGSIDPTHRFTGKELDPETGLYYYGGRYYDPEISRFISPDPFVQAPSDPQNLNRYSYVNNNPQNYIDPSGYGFWKKIGKFFKKVFRVFNKYIMPVVAPGLYLMNKAISSIPPNVRHGLEIFGGVLMLMSGNPAGIFFIAQGGTGFCKSSGCQTASGIFGFLGAASSGGGGSSGGGDSGSDGPGNDYPGGGNWLGGLMLVNALGSGNDPTKEGPRVIYGPNTVSSSELRRRLDIFAQWANRDVIVTSGDRFDPKANELAGGVPGSRHLSGIAADIRIQGLTVNQAAILADEAIFPNGRPLFPGVIFEFHHVHVDLRNGPPYRGIRWPATGAQKPVSGFLRDE